MTDQEKIARLERKVEALEAWAVNAAKLLKAQQDGQTLVEKTSQLSDMISKLTRK